MNKQDEMDILRNAIAKLGDDSYIGGWLASIADEVERDLRSDFLPSYSFTESLRILASQKQQADKAARDLIADAKAKALAIHERATAEIATIRAKATAELNAALRALY